MPFLYGALFIGYYTISNNCNCCDAANNNLSFLSFISCDERVPKSSQVKGMNKHLCHMYEILKDSKDCIV